MTFRRNILASYTSQIYVTLVGFLIIPMYLQYMGAETYGLVGFFTMLQAFFNLLDIGLTPTVARETARFRGGAIDSASYRRLLRALQFIFLAIALLGGGSLLLSSELIAASWLKTQALPLSQVKTAIQLMAIGIALRWMAGLYRGCISGAEKLIWLSGFNAIIATLRFVCVLPVLIWVGHSPTIFFGYQLLVAVAELVILATKAHSGFPPIPHGESIEWSLPSLINPIKPALKFSLTIAFTSSVWILVTQTDKFILSTLLPLAEYGYFTLAVLAANGVMIIGGPISSALLPRLAKLEAEGNAEVLIDLYRKATQMVAAISIPACLVLSIFSEQVLWVWTGDAHAALMAAPVLKLYALGNGILSMAAFPYYLQYAKGDLRLHLIGNAIFLITLIPTLFLATSKFGGVGAGYAWFTANLLYFIFWLPRVHNRFSKELHFRWLLFDVLPIATSAAIAAAVASHVSITHQDRFLAFCQLIGLGLGISSIALLGALLSRARIFREFRLFAPIKK